MIATPKSEKLKAVALGQTNVIDAADAIEA
jgi:hypothetical protein